MTPPTPQARVNSSLLARIRPKPIKNDQFFLAAARRAQPGRFLSPCKEGERLQWSYGGLLCAWRRCGVWWGRVFGQTVRFLQSQVLLREPCAGCGVILRTGRHIKGERDHCFPHRCVHRRFSSSLHPVVHGSRLVRRVHVSTACAWRFATSSTAHCILYSCACAEFVCCAPLDAMMVVLLWLRFTRWRGVQYATAMQATSPCLL